MVILTRFGLRLGMIDGKYWRCTQSSGRLKDAAKQPRHSPPGSNLELRKVRGMDD